MFTLKLCLITLFTTVFNTAFCSLNNKNKSEISYQNLENKNVNTSFFTFHHPWLLILSILILAIIFTLFLFCAIRLYYVKQLIKVTEWERRVLLVFVGKQNPKNHLRYQIAPNPV